MIGRLFHRFTRAPWWVHVIATLSVLLVLNIAALVVTAVLFVDFVNEHGPPPKEIPRQSEPDLGERLELARRFAPTLRLHSQELFVPIPRSAYIGLTQLKEQEGRFVRITQTSPTEQSLPASEGTCIRSRGCVYFLDVRGAEPDPPKHSERSYAVLENKLIRTGVKPTVYAHVTRYDDSDEYAVQYWFLYMFNFRLNEHESDLEQITVRLDPDKKPVDVFYSAHEGGNVIPWDALEKQGDHPVDYVALGSHANYARPGRHPVRVGCKRVLGGIKQCLRGRKILVDVADGRGKRLSSSDYQISELSGPVYIGSYGSGNYVVLTRRPDVLNDPRLRTVWADPLRPLH